MSSSGGAEPDARPDRPGQFGLAPAAQLVVQAAGLGLGHLQQPRDQRVRAEAAVPDADRVLVAEQRGQRFGAVAVEREAGDADAVVVLRPQRERRESGDRVEAAVQVRGERPLAVGDGVHAELLERFARRGQRDGSDHVR